MDGTTERRSLPGPEYVTRVTFHAPIRFCFRWCTDYRASDPQLEGGGYARRILERHRDRVVYEDLAKLPNGWSWARYEVRLDPPNRWHMESLGNQRNVIADYALTPVSEERTRFELRYRRGPAILPFRRVPRSERDPEDARTWRMFRRALERDYRASRRRRRARR